MIDSMYQERLAQLAKALGGTPGSNLRMEQADLQDGNGRRWWLVGCKEGDQPLPRTKGIPTAPQALQAAEDWLAPELFIRTRT